MGKILLIEPHKILRQAISLSLFPEHEVHAEENITASQLGSLGDYDLLIIDGAALRENKLLNLEIAKAVQNLKTPTVWLEEGESSQVPKRERLEVVSKPIQRDSLQSALQSLFSPEAGAKKRQRKSAAVSTGAETSQREAKGKTSEMPEQAAFGFIDLVDVVQEQPQGRQRKRSARKSK